MSQPSDDSSQTRSRRSSSVISASLSDNQSSDGDSGTSTSSAELSFSMPFLGRELASEGVIFIIGPDRKEFLIHKGVLARLSAPLDALVNDKSDQSIDRKIQWPDVDEETFIRFSQFAYSGDYTEAEPLIIEGDSREGKSIDAQIQSRERQTSGVAYPHHSSLYDYWCGIMDDTCEDEWRRAKRRKLSDFNRKDIEWTRKYLLGQHVNGFRSFCLPLGRRCVSSHEVNERGTLDCTRAPHAFHGWKPRPNLSPLENYEQVFKSHLSLHRLAGKYHVDSLHSLTFHRLHRTLFHFNVHFPVRLLDVLSLAEDACTTSGSIEVLRLVAFYLSLFLQGLGSLPSYHTLLRNRPFLASYITCSTAYFV